MRLLALYRSILGKKVIVAVTGAVMMGFLLMHVAGNLTVFLPDVSPGIPEIDVYARSLRTMGEPLVPRTALLWLVRGVLGGALVLHVTCVVQLALHNRRARPIGYRKVQYVAATPSARSMLYTGGLLLAFLVIHLLQFTTGTIDSAQFVRGAVYANLSRTFHAWSWAMLYVGAMGMLGLHLYHGVWSLFQSLGLDSPDRNRGLRRLATALAIGLSLCFASVPLAFASGILAPPPIVGD